MTPLALDEFDGPRGDFYKNMFAKCPAGRPGAADEVAALAGLVMGPQGAFITGSDFLIDGGHHQLLLRPAAARGLARDKVADRRNDALTSSPR